MRSFTTLLAAGALASGAAADVIAGFNSGSTLADGTPKQLSDYTAEFKAAANLVGAPTNFNAVRLYTMVQGGTTADPIAAFQAAMNTNTKMLLGIWCSGTDSIQNDLTALNTALKTYGDKFTNLVMGISVGSEDLYRNSATGVANKAGVGADPSVVAKFIGQVRDAIKGTSLANVPVGHVDTWDVWGNSSNKAVVDAIDFLGTDAYPFFESNRGDNSIGQAVPLWNQALQASLAAANGKPVWITETGWPYAGPNWGQAVPSVANQKTYWDQVGCTLFGKMNTFWFTMRDTNPEDKNQFAITDNLSSTPRFNLTCPAVKAVSSSTSSASSSQSTGSGSSSTGSSSTGSGSSNGGSSGNNGGSTSGSASGSTSGSSSTTSTNGTGNAAAALGAPGSMIGASLALAAAVLAF